MPVLQSGRLCWTFVRRSEDFRVTVVRKIVVLCDAVAVIPVDKAKVS